MSLFLVITVLFSGLSSLVAADIPIVRGRVGAANQDVLQGLSVRIEGASNGHGLDIHQQDDATGEQVSEFDVRLQDREPDRGTAKAAIVSVKELMHPPDKKAVRAFQSALHLSDSGRYDDAVTELEKAIRISPEFAAAHTNLGVQYFRLGRVQESAAEWARAIEISGPQPLTLCNLATAQALLQQFVEAEKSARAALTLDSGYVQANLVLGFILVNRPATRSEGVRNLEKAAPKFASARVFLEKWRTSQ